MVFDTREPAATGKGGKITFPDTRKRTIVVGAGEYGGPASMGLRTTPQGVIARFDPATGIRTVRAASELSIHSFFAPQNPTDISATATGDTTVDIDGTIDTAGNDGVEIHMSTTQGSGYALEATVEESAFPVEITGLTAATTYYFVLRAFIWDGVQRFASFTSEVSATTGAGGSAPVAPGTPSISEISRTATTMTLEATWTDVADETSYEWTAGSDDGTTWSDSGTEAADATSVQFVATRTNADHTGFFCIRACNASGCSVNTCNGLTVAGNLTAPSSLSATNPSGSDVDVDWSDMSGATVADETAIERRFVGGSFTEIDTVTFGVTHYDDNALADGDYEYRVRHRDTGSGNTSPYSNIDPVGINSGGGGSENPNEPAGFAQITNRGFSAVNEDGWNDADTGGCCYSVPVQDATAPTSPPNVARVRFPAAEWLDGSSPCSPCASRNFTPVKELYFSFTFKVSANWYGHDGQAINKILYFAPSTINVGDGVIAFMCNGDGGIFDLHVRLQGPGSEGSLSTGPNIESNLSNPNLTRDTWHTIEVHLVVNTGQNYDGEVHVWVDSVKTHEYTDVRFYDVAGLSEADHEWRNVRWNPVYGGGGGSIPQNGDQYQYMDNFYISAP